ncbi:MAG: hypothetical protein JW788_06365 [Candidatus Omnitrophica bacterium]|nr:hypothetical protein [Candidatus Omnitrophota bacterium]
MKIKDNFFLLICGIFPLLFYYPCFAQLTLDQREIKLSYKPQETIRGRLTLFNSSTETFTVKTYCQDFVFLSPHNGLKGFRPLGSTPYSFGKWINITPSLFIIPPNSQQLVEYSISIPQQAKGSYNAILFFETISGTPVKGNSVGVIFRAGCSIYLEPVDKILAVKIEDISVVKGSIRGEFLNAGNAILLSEATYFVMGTNNFLFQRGEIQKFCLMPQDKASFVIGISDKIVPGKYTLIVNFSLEGRKALVKEVDFLKDSSGLIQILGIKD